MQITCLFCNDVLFKSFIINKKCCKCLKTKIDLFEQHLLGNKQMVLSTQINRPIINMFDTKDWTIEILYFLKDKKATVQISKQYTFLHKFDFNIEQYPRLLKIIKTNMMIA